MYMDFLSVEEYADMVMKDNPDESKEELVQALEEMLAAQENGETCIVCGGPIWAAGSALAGCPMCFTCITGETDDSEDYEII